MFEVELMAACFVVGVSALGAFSFSFLNFDCYPSWACISFFGLVGSGFEFTFGSVISIFSVLRMRSGLRYPFIFVLSKYRTSISWANFEIRQFRTKKKIVIVSLLVVNFGLVPFFKLHLCFLFSKKELYCIRKKILA